MNTLVLLSTVGGSHQPVVKAIRSLNPQYVLFFCTDRNRRTGEPGSLPQVTGSGKVIKANHDDAKPTLPNIPTQENLSRDQFECCIVPSDDLDGAYVAMRGAIASLRVRFPGARFVADYTGGTKTMTAALVCVALDQDEVALQLVTGARRDLVGVRDGAEQTMAASVERVRLDRAMAPYVAAWKRYAYREAAAGLDRVRIAVNAADRERHSLVLVLSRAFAHWDDFDHAAALKLVEPFAGPVAGHYPSLLPALRVLSDDADARRHPARLFDLWLNAQRRASQGRFDDPVARLYRLIEWTAQWLIRSKLGADSSDFPAAQLPSDVHARPDSDGKIKLGLWHAWQVVSTHVQGPADQFIADHGSELLDLLSIRNKSILAHGIDPMARSSWERMERWSQDRFLPVLRHYAKDAGLKKRLEQLPTDPPEPTTD